MPLSLTRKCWGTIKISEDQRSVACRRLLMPRANSWIWINIQGQVFDFDASIVIYRLTKVDISQSNFDFRIALVFSWAIFSIHVYVFSHPQNVTTWVIVRYFQ